jgi:hypothetical protein
VFSGGLGDAAADAAAMSSSLVAVQTELDVIKAQLDAQDKQRRLAFYIGLGSAIFAGLRLGIIAFPKIKERLPFGT